MKLWVGITDDDWFRFLAEIKPDEVNFWQPSGRRTFQVLQPGELFLFEGTRDLMAIYQVQRCAWVNGAQGDLCAGIPQGRKHSVRAGGVKSGAMISVSWSRPAATRATREWSRIGRRRPQRVPAHSSQLRCHQR